MVKNIPLNRSITKNLHCKEHQCKNRDQNIGITWIKANISFKKTKLDTIKSKKLLAISRKVSVHRGQKETNHYGQEILAPQTGKMNNGSVWMCEVE